MLHAVISVVFFIIYPLKCIWGVCWWSLVFAADEVLHSVLLPVVLEHLVLEALLLLELNHQLALRLGGLRMDHVVVVTSTLDKLEQAHHGYFKYYLSLWLSETYLGQYSSESSLSFAMSLRKTFLHFLQARMISMERKISWSWVSAWHSGQSNHSLQHWALTYTCAFKMCLHILMSFLLNSNINYN